MTLRLLIHAEARMSANHLTGRSAHRRGPVRMVADQTLRTTVDAPPRQVVFGVIALSIAMDMAPP
jgi:hypothetical protein